MWLGLMFAGFVPLPLLALAATGWIGFWPVLLYLTLFCGLMDESLGRKSGTESAVAQWLGRIIPTLLGLGHFALLLLAILTVSGATGLPDLTRWSGGVAFALFFGQISTANAHELIHRPGRFERRLGRLVFISLLFGHHVSAHLMVHHRHVATPLDPNTARRGEGVYRFLIRAWSGSFKAGLAGERQRLLTAGRRRRHFSNPYYDYLFGAIAVMALAAGLGGASGFFGWLAIAILAQIQLLLSDYVQHYGLQRRRLANGKFEPVAARHSWNAPHRFSAALMLNAPRHSDHHLNPSRAYPELRLPPKARAPRLPRSIPVMSVIALWPGLWRRIMDPRLAAVEREITR